MKLPIQAQAVLRNPSVSEVNSTNVGIVASRKKCITGMAKCTKSGNVLFTGSETICAQNNHNNCTAAKQAAVNSITAECTAQGGVPQQSGNRCNVGDNCRRDGDC